MSNFTQNFLANSIIKPSSIVITKIIEDKEFLKKDAFDSEVDASIYPLPSMIYHLAKTLLARR
jgi:hypothetical protein